MGRFAAAPQHFSTAYFNSRIEDPVVTDVAVAHDHRSLRANVCTDSGDIAAIDAVTGIAVTGITAASMIAVATVTRQNNVSGLGCKAGKETTKYDEPESRPAGPAGSKHAARGEA